ncbi:conserved hypothetical protein [Magnetospirillum sp. UT-4]|nr:conserved hypothetical protein [Magnetospirillum sp. UT-4]
MARLALRDAPGALLRVRLVKGPDQFQRTKNHPGMAAFEKETDDPGRQHRHRHAPCRHEPTGRRRVGAGRHGRRPRNRHRHRPPP